MTSFAESLQKNHQGFAFGADNAVGCARMDVPTEFAQIPELLVRACASGRMCVVLGPQLAVGSGFPTPQEAWQTVFTRAWQQAAAERRDELDEARAIFSEPGNQQDKYALLTTIMGEAFVDGSFVAVLRGIQPTPTPSHQALAGLTALYMATCPDELMQRARSERNAPCATTFLDDGEDTRLPGPGDVLALGGTSFKSGVLPFARTPLPLTDQHRNRLRKALGRSSAFLFVGFNAADDELIFVSHILNSVYPKNGPQRFWLASRDARTRARAAAYALEPIWLRSEETAEGFVRALAKRSEKQNAERASLWPLPEGTPEEIRSALAAGHEALAIADLALAAERGLSICAKCDPQEQPQLLLEGLAILYFALHRTLFEEPTDAALISVERRERVLEVLEKGLTALEGAPEPWRKQVTLLADRFDSLMVYASTTARGNDDTDASALDEPCVFDQMDTPILRKIWHQAQSGQWDQALAQLPRFEHPWKENFFRSVILCIGNQLERALVLMLELCRQFPNRAELDGLTAYLLLALSRHEEAAHHAERAFQQFPCRFFRYLQGDILARQGHSERAWMLLLPLADSDNPQIMRLRAMLAALVVPDEARGIFTRYLDKVPDDHSARYAFAIFEQNAGRRQEAAELAWSIFEGNAKTSLQADILYFIGQSQWMAESAPNDETRKRVVAIADELARRFVGDERAARMRQTLLRRLDEPVPAESPKLASVHDVMLEGLPTVRALSDSYERIGVPSFARLSVESGIAPATLLAHLSQPAEHRQLPALSLAIDSRMIPTPTVFGMRLLAGPLELALLHALDVWSVLPMALGPTGRVVVFEFVAASITRAGEAAPEDSADKALAKAMAQAIESGLLETMVFDSAIAQSTDDIARNSLTTKYTLSLHIELAYYEAIVANSDLFLLCADALMASPRGVLGKAAALLVANADLSFRERLELLQLRLMYVPAFVGAVHAQHEKQRLEKLVQLAELGFAGALGARDILVLARQHEGVDKVEPARILGRAERLARQPQHFAQHDACATLAFRYAQAIWDATCGEQAWADSEARALTAALLSRADEVEGAAHVGMLEGTFHNIGQLALSFPLASGVALIGAQPQLSEHSPAGRLWQFINTWTGNVGHRKGALTRSLSRLWLILDQFTKGVGPSKEMAAPLVLGTFGSLNLTASADMGVFEAPSILSALWSERPFDNCKVGLVAQKSNERHDVELEALYPLLMNQVERGLYHLTEATCSTILVVPNAGNVPHSTRPEVALLRLEGRNLIDFAHELALKQGIHDGRAYDRLMQLKEKPTDTALRRTIAREALQLPFIQFREDPTALLQWAHVRVPGFPQSLEELCAMLSENIESPSDNRTLGKHFAARRQEGGLWWGHGNLSGLYGMATQVPGTIALHVFELNWPENPVEFGQIVASYLNVLSLPHEHPAGRIAQAIFGLRIVAEYNQHVFLPQGDVDLRERLPERLVNLLDAVDQAPNEGTLAAYETGLLRFCATQVSRLDSDSRLSPRHHLWLTFRLFQWVVAQLDTLTPTAKLAAFEVLARGLQGPALELASDDLLDPAGFDRENGIDYRLVTILYALSQMNDVAKEGQDEEPEAVKAKAWRFSSPVLEDRFAKLAARTLTKREKRLRALGQTPTAFDWDAPGTIPDLAILALVTSRREGFARIEPAARLRWIRDLPSGPADTTRAPWFVACALYQAINAALPRLGAEESNAYDENLRLLEGNAEASPWRWLGLTALYRAGRSQVTEEEVLALLLAHLDVPAAPKVFGWALLGVARKTPDNLAAFVERVLDTAKARGIDPVPLAEGITFVMALSKSRPAILKAREIFSAWHARPPFQGDERMKRLAAQFGLG